MYKLPRCPAPPFVALCLRAPPSPGDVGLMLCLSGKRRGRQPGVVESETGPCSVVGLIVASGPFLARSLVDLTCLWSRVTPGSASIRRPPGSPPPRRPPPAAARESPAGGAGGRIPMWYSTRPPVAASFAILLALLFFSPVASAGTISRLACEYARSHL